MFNKDSAMVSLYMRKIGDGSITIDDVPELGNLKVIVESLLK